MAKAPSKFSSGLRKKKKRFDTDTAPSAAAPTTATKPAPAAKAAGRAKGAHRKLGQVLLDMGLINEEQLWQLVENHRQAGERIGKCAVNLQLIDEDTLLKALAEQQGMQVVNLAADFVPPRRSLEIVSEMACTSYKIVPYQLVGNVLTVAMADPANVVALDELRMLFSVDDVQAVVATEEQINATVERAYAGHKDSIENIISEMETDEEVGEDLSVGAGMAGSIDLESMEEMADAAPVRKLLNMVLLLAIREKASDVHFEPFETEFKMRYRVDGVMYELVPPPRHLAPAISSRIKVMANLDIAERRVPQDGRIELNVGGNPVDLRVSVLPTMFGEGVVMRVLDRTVVSLDLNKVGMTPKLLAHFRKLIQVPHGIVLVTGPTGSGKTTTLYSCLNELNDIGVKIITTEDPIEYDIDGLIQVPINPDIDVTFAACLRAILRQDPDIILVGEIRDFETAQMSIQSSLTGHLVFSTLHTNDAPGAITRLRDMGVPPFLITATVEGVLAQRLVRKICVECREEFTPSAEMLMEVNLTPEQVKGKKFYRGRGCENCNNTGYRGRCGIFELFILNDEIRELIMEGGSKDQVVAAAKRNGMTTLREAGLKALFEGVTTIDEVARETIVEDEG